VALPDVVVPPPAPPFPILFGIAGGIILVCALIIVSSKFDETKGPLTISLVVIVSFVAALSFSLYYTVPQDPTTSAIVGALTAGVGAVITYWLTKKDDNRPPGSNM
jgi:drug/metabolite transporter (DMT)-like permease